MTYSKQLPSDGRVRSAEVDHVSIGPPRSQPARHRLELRALMDHIRSIDIARFESASSEEQWNDLKPRTSDALHEAMIWLARLLEESEPSTFAAEEVGSGVAIALEDAPAGWETGVADLAFMAQVELRHRAQRLSSLTAQHPMLIAECDGALRRIVRALVAIDRALSYDLDDAGSVEPGPDLELSLHIRRVYTSFRRRVADVDHSSTSMRARLLASAREIAVLIGLPVYPLIRLADRLHLRGLQQRLIVCLRMNPLDELDGRRLWTDIVSFASMLSQINNRQELFAHDARVVIRAVESLAKLGELSPSAAQELSLIEGRDDDLDALLTSGCRTLDAWTPIVARLANDLGRTRPEAAE